MDWVKPLWWAVSIPSNINFQLLILEQHIWKATEINKVIFVPQNLRTVYFAKKFILQLKENTNNYLQYINLN